MTDLLSLITPLNLATEKEKFLASSQYHPIFHYLWQDQVIDPDFTIKLKYPLWDSIKVQDHEGIVRAAQDLFQVTITQDLLAQARSDARITGSLSHGSVEQIAHLFNEAFKIFDLDYETVISPLTGFNLRPRHAEKTILISHDIHFDYFSMEAEVHHELVHILRYRNGKHNKIKRSQRFLPTEEGLASWCQDNTNDDNGLAQHAMEYIVSSVGIKGSLREIFDSLCELGMSRELAWKRASRHKFGFVDTKEPGDILKPAMYYQNEQKIALLNSEERLRLFVGKISLDELVEYPKYSGLWPGDQIKNYFKL